MMAMLERIYFSGSALCMLMGSLFFGLGLLLLSPWGARAVDAFPRSRFSGYLLSTLAWVWVGVELYLRPVDLLAFVSPKASLGVALILIPISWVLLSNLLSVRALGGLLMLWPMPVILAVRSDPSLWRLVPVIVGYVHLVLGMVFVFHPWTLRVLCQGGALRVGILKLVGMSYALIGCLMIFAAMMVQTVVA